VVLIIVALVVVVPLDIVILIGGGVKILVLGAVSDEAAPR
jgi:hypothetical protein